MTGGINLAELDKHKLLVKIKLKEYQKHCKKLQKMRSHSNSIMGKKLDRTSQSTLIKN